jgi:hypothetical protein
MNEAKLSRKEEGLNSQAKKVLNAVPMLSAWTKDHIAHELRRTGVHISRDVFDGILNYLRGHGLIREPESGCFIRVAAKPKTSQSEIKIVQSISKPSSAIKMKDADAWGPFAPIKENRVDELIDLADRIKAMAIPMQDFADRLVRVAEAVEADIDKAKAENALPQETLAALKTLGLIKS